MFKNGVVDCFELEHLDIGKAIEGVDGHPPGTRKGIPVPQTGFQYISCFEEMNDFGQGDGDGIDGEVALMQVLFNSIAFEWSDIDSGFASCVFDNDAAGFVVEVDIVASKFVCEGAC